MQRLPVDSTDLVAVGYDPKTRVLEIEFKEGRIYQYDDVAQDIYDRFIRADSFGQYFYAFINGHYRYQRVEQAKDAPRQSALAFVTGNLHKFRALQEACEPLGIELEQLDLPVDEIQSHDAEDIAVKKAKQAYKFADRPVVVNDVFWNILALHGFPGAFMSYVTAWFKAEDFLRLMDGRSERSVCRTHTLVYYDGQRSKIFRKDYWGSIATEPRGKGSFSIDQVVLVPEQGKTLAELRDAGEPTIPPEQSVGQEFAKWYKLQRRLGKV